MTISRRSALKLGFTSMTGFGLATIMPFATLAQDKMGHTYKTMNDSLSIHPVDHASFVMQTPGMVIYNDPVGAASNYSDLPPADLILVSHEHGDHFNVGTLQALTGENTKLITNPAVYGMLPDDLKAKATFIGNGDTTTMGDITFNAIPAYNTTEGRLNYHPEGRDNGYVLTIDGLRVYIAGDTEDIPEMRALKDIDIAFLPMNLPYTMDIEQAASAVGVFAPKAIYPYHYRGADLDKFAKLVSAGPSGSNVILYDWYG